ncbi:MAG TPA: hypothetical protein VGD01_14310 [Candidatus Elarobacter sp.]|jgi:hypothetical protein
MSVVAVYSYTHSVAYVADNILKSLKDIVRESGLDPALFAADWQLYLNGIQTWLESGHLKTVSLEIYNPRTNALITRWDLEIAYSWTTGDGGFFTDTEQLKYAIRKAGVAPSEARYRLMVDHTNSGYPRVSGWSATTHRSTAGMVRQSLGATIDHSGLGASTSYLRRA